jgi:hypothetical protein
MSRQPAADPADLTQLWKELESEAALVERLLRPVVERPGPGATLDELQRAVAALQRFQERCVQTKTASLMQQRQFERAQPAQPAQQR